MTTKSNFFNRLFRNWKTSSGGVVLGVTQIVNGIQTGDVVTIVTGAMTIIGGIFAKD